jgi:hypothetical protein
MTEGVTSAATPRVLKTMADLVDQVVPWYPYIVNAMRSPLVLVMDA